MINRFSNREIIKNESKRYYDYLSDRDKKYINQYNTPTFKYPTEDELKKISYIEHVWTIGDRLYKLSNRYYGDPYDWWIILKFNKIGSEFMIKTGDVIKIPTPLEDILGYML
jgi:nucleoid-associated protein YgaU